MRIRELALTYRPIPGTRQPGRLQTPAAAVACLRPLLEYEACEVFLIACLDTKLQLIAVSPVGRGSLDCCIVHPREVFKAALLANAAAILTAHNHPSGDPTPSPDDLALFERLRAGGDLLGIEAYDHLIIGGEMRYWSAREAGRPT